MGTELPAFPSWSRSCSHLPYKPVRAICFLWWRVVYVLWLHQNFLNWRLWIYGVFENIKHSAPAWLLLLQESAKSINQAEEAISRSQYQCQCCYRDSTHQTRSTPSIDFFLPPAKGEGVFALPWALHTSAAGQCAAPTRPATHLEQLAVALGWMLVSLSPLPEHKRPLMSALRYHSKPWQNILHHDADLLHALREVDPKQYLFHSLHAFLTQPWI